VPSTVRRAVRRKATLFFIPAVLPVTHHFLCCRTDSLPGGLFHPPPYASTIPRLACSRRFCLRRAVPAAIRRQLARVAWRNKRGAHVRGAPTSAFTALKQWRPVSLRGCIRRARIHRSPAWRAFATACTRPLRRHLTWLAAGTLFVALRRWNLDLSLAAIKTTHKQKERAATQQQYGAVLWVTLDA